MARMTDETNRAERAVGARAGAGRRGPARPRIHELDMLRVLTALGVVAVHTLGATVAYQTTQQGEIVQHGIESAMHYTREVFMFTTALVLAYSYVGKPFDLKTFARKRGVGVVVPYVLWSVFYILEVPHPAAPLELLGTISHALVNGDASYQLYYILLTIQFYALFPILLWLLPLFDRHRRLVLGVSGALELAFLAANYYLIQAGPLMNTPLGAWMNAHEGLVVLVYQFYFVLGALCALHLDRLRALALRHGRVIAPAMGATLAAYWGYYAYCVGVLHLDIAYVISVLQPIMVPYSVVTIAFLWWISCRWASGAAAGGRPAGSRFWRTLADASFGIYLVHPILITFAMLSVVPLLPAAPPVPVRIAIVWLVAVAGSAAVSIALMRTPILSRLVGRATPLPPALAAHLAVGGRAIGGRIDAWRAAWRAAGSRGRGARPVAPAAGPAGGGAFEPFEVAGDEARGDVELARSL